MPIIIREQQFTASVGDEEYSDESSSEKSQELDLKAIVDLCTEKVLQKIKAKEER